MASENGKKPTPLTPEEQQQRDELNRRAAEYAQEQAEAERQAQYDALASARHLVDVLGTNEISAAFEAVISDSKVPYDVKARVQSMKMSLYFNINEINGQVAAVSAPVQTPA